MRSILIVFTLFVFSKSFLSAQNITIEVDSTNAPAARGLHSFVFATHGNYWLFIGGWKRGLHGFYPTNAFPNTGRNDSAFVYNRVTNQWWSAHLNQLPQSQYLALTTTNAEFHQRDTILYVVGGYGWNFNTNSHETFSSLIGINVPAFLAAIINNQPLSPHCRQVSDPWFAVTGAHLERIDSLFFLVFGHRYNGFYNLNPSSQQQTYTEEIRIFTIHDDGQQMQFFPIDTIRDTVEFHRRDFNLVPQIFPGGDFGFTAFTGVFQNGIDLPHLNCVNITASGYTATAGPDQYLNQYHTAVMPVYQQQQNLMHTYFFGGIGLYAVDSNNVLVVDSLVPFVSTISRMTRDNAGQFDEFVEQERMDGFYGTNAQFILNPNVPAIHEKIINADSLPIGRTHVGWIYGGIHADAPNVAYNTNMSRPSNRIWDVYINVGSITSSIEPQEAFTSSIVPNPAGEFFDIAFSSSLDSTLIKVVSMSGQIVWESASRINGPVRIPCSLWSPGVYVVAVVGNSFMQYHKVIIQ